MKKIIIIILTCLCCIMPVFADSGPKPSIIIKIKGLDNQHYYVTLLSSKETNGPFSQYNSEDELLYEKDTNEYRIWEAMKDYQDQDGFYFLQYFQDCSETHEFQWTYYPPETFKVLIYFPKTQQFIVSSIYTKYAYDSYYIVNVSHNNSIDMSIHFMHYCIALMKRLSFTLVIEVLIAVMFEIRGKKQWITMITINLLTQILLNIALMLFKGFLFTPLIYLLVECIIIFIEYKIYKRYFENSYQYKVKVYAIVANVISFITGMIIF